MKTRRKGHALELLCEICDQCVAEIYRDRFAVYSFHFGKWHTSGFGLEEMQAVYKVAQSDRYLKLKCATCNQLPCAVVQLHRLTITTKHKAQNWQTHPNALTLEDIEEICRIIGQSDVILSDELDVPGLSAA